jgi:hypothetical protein
LLQLRRKDQPAAGYWPSLLEGFRAMTLRVYGIGFWVKGRPQPDYEYWSVEELRALGAQLQLPNARAKTRDELLEMFNGRTTAHQHSCSFLQPPP